MSEPEDPSVSARGYGQNPCNDLRPDDGAPTPLQRAPHSTITTSGTHLAAGVGIKSGVDKEAKSVGKTGCGQNGEEDPPAPNRQSPETVSLHRRRPEKEWRTETGGRLGGQRLLQGQGGRKKGLEEVRQDGKGKESGRRCRPVLSSTRRPSQGRRLTQLLHLETEWRSGLTSSERCCVMYTWTVGG